MCILLTFTDDNEVSVNKSISKTPKSEKKKKKLSQSINNDEGKSKYIIKICLWCY